MELEKLTKNKEFSDLLCFLSNCKQMNLKIPSRERLILRLNKKFHIPLEKSYYTLRDFERTHNKELEEIGYFYKSDKVFYPDNSYISVRDLNQAELKKSKITDYYNPKL